MNDMKALGELSLFQGLDDEDRALPAREAVWRDYHSGETIFHQGDRVLRFHVLVRGVVKLFRSTADGKEQTLYLVEEGEPFCLCTIYGNESMPVSALAMIPCLIASFPGPVMEKLGKRNPQLLLNILRVLNNRLMRSMQMIEDLALRDIQQRMASFLLHSLRSGGDDPARVTLSVPRQEVAKILGTTPETISRVLARMVQDGTIEAKGREIHIPDPDLLEEMAG